MSVAKLCETLLNYKELYNSYCINGQLDINEPQIASNKLETTNSDLLNTETFNLEVFTTTANGKTELNITPNEHKLVNGVKVTYFKRLTKDHTHFSPALLWRLRKEILKFHFSIIENKNVSLDCFRQKPNLIIHIHAWWNLVSVLSCLVAKLYKIPVIITPRGTITTYTTTNKNSFKKKIIHYIVGKKLLEYCHLHVTSEKEKQDVLSLIRPKSITIISNLVELSVEQDLTNIIKPEIERKDKVLINKQTKSFQLIFLSRIEQKKGLELVFKALSTVLFKWQLTIAGTGDEEYLSELHQLAENLKIKNNLIWKGHIDNNKKFDLMAEHDLLILTSHNENFANVVIESLSVGTPVLISKEVGLADYVINKKLGWVTDLKIDKIRHSINISYHDVENRIRIKNEAKKIILEDFEPSKLIKEYYELYNKII